MSLRILENSRLRVARARAGVLLGALLYLSFPTSPAHANATNPVGSLTSGAVQTVTHTTGAVGSPGGAPPVGETGSSGSGGATQPVAQAPAPVVEKAAAPVVEKAAAPVVEKAAAVEKAATPAVKTLSRSVEGSPSPALAAATRTVERATTPIAETATQTLKGAAAPVAKTIEQAAAPVIEAATRAAPVTEAATQAVERATTPITRTTSAPIVSAVVIPAGAVVGRDASAPADGANAIAAATTPSQARSGVIQTPSPTSPGAPGSPSKGLAVPTHGVPTHGVPTYGVPMHGVPTHGRGSIHVSTVARRAQAWGAADSITLAGSSWSRDGGAADNPQRASASVPLTPPPGSASGGSSGATAAFPGGAISIFLTLASLLLLAGSQAMRRLRLASELWRAAPFVLIPERPG
jgi:hypothetical protein